MKMEFAEKAWRLVESLRRCEAVIATYEEDEKYKCLHKYPSVNQYEDAKRDRPVLLERIEALHEEPAPDTGSPRDDLRCEVRVTSTPSFVTSTSSFWHEFSKMLFLLNGGKPEDFGKAR